MKPADQAGSAAFVDTAINRSDLEPTPVPMDLDECVHRQVCAAPQAEQFSASRGHPVYAVGLPARAISMTIGELAPGQATSRHRHAYESMIYVLDGEGHTELTHGRVSWRAGDAFYIAPWQWHQHVAGGGPVRYLTCTNLPLLHGLGQTVLRQEADQ